MKLTAVRHAGTVLDSAAARLAANSVVFSAIQPTGVFHLGNYLGAVRSWVDIAKDAPASAKIVYATADLHAITVPKEPSTLRRFRHQAIASIIASGVDPNRCTVYHQSQVPEHTQLSWFLSTITGMGYLNRMVQWKSKANLGDVSIEDLDSQKLTSLNLGLFAYPVLQAADILVHKATHVPVGEDQAQHLELTRYITSTFNHKYGAGLFPTPATLLAPYRKILSLRDPSKKMSKSDPDQNGCIYITDSPETIRAKVKVAVTDSIQGPITYDPDARPGVSNLILAASGLLRTTPQELMAGAFSSIANHRQLKDAVADVFVSELAPVREKYHQLASDQAYLESIANSGAEKARQSASQTLAEVYKAAGFD